MNKDSKAYWKGKLFQAEFKGPDGKPQLASNWTMRVSHGGLQRKITLPSPNQVEAAELAVKFYRTLKRSGSWETAEVSIGRVTASPGASCTVGDWVKAVSELNILNPRTLGSYVYALRWFAREHLGASGSKKRFDAKGDGAKQWHAKLDSVPLIDLSPERIQRIVDRFVHAEAGNPLEKRRAATSVRSFVRNAKAMFSKGILKRLPCPLVPTPFTGVELPEVGPMRYVSQVDVGALLIQARENLREQKPALWVAFLLAFTAGLRRREMDTLTWPQVRFEKGTIWIRSSETFQAKTDGAEDEIFIDETVMTELKWWQNHPDCKSEYVLPGLPKMPVDPRDYRCDSTVFTQLLSWLREQGVNGDKPIHTLRKEFGSFIAANGDIHVAQKQLRHSQISTTASYYAENRRRVAPGISLESPATTNPLAKSK
jgi:integrase